jgi:hypothetical protein
MAGRKDEKTVLVAEKVPVGETMGFVVMTRLVEVLKTFGSSFIESPDGVVQAVSVALRTSQNRSEEIVRLQKQLKEYQEKEEKLHASIKESIEILKAAGAKEIGKEGSTDYTTSTTLRRLAVDAALAIAIREDRKAERVNGSEWEMTPWGPMPMPRRRGRTEPGSGG